MRIIESVTEMQQQADTWRRENKRIALVPTMGYFHEGHLTLMRAVRNHGDVVVISIFVNPAQFGPTEDLDSYPRDLERDLRLARELGVDVAFVPRKEEIYPDGFQTFVEVKEITQALCGKSRPVFFRGVATVVAKLFHIVKPHVAIFGEKDFQQLMTIRRMVADLNMDVEILGHPTIREPDGLAMSSRNAYLSPDQRVLARRLSQSLREAQGLVNDGKRGSDAILKCVREVLAEGGDVRIDYAELRDPRTFQEVSRVDSPTLLALAVFVGMARLIDNCVLTVPS